VAVDVAGALYTDVWFTGCVFAGVQAFTCVLRRVAFRGCKLDSVNFREAALTDVTFEDCVLRDVDFGGAKLQRVKFPGSTVSGLDFTKATCANVDLRTARLGVRDDSGADSSGAGIKAGFESLSGVRIDTLQLMTLAPFLAHHLGITVKYLLRGGPAGVPPGDCPASARAPAGRVTLGRIGKSQADFLERTGATPLRPARRRERVPYGVACAHPETAAGLIV
jgi:uncharacterized protein YjbI with pentapeptide repeats